MSGEAQFLVNGDVITDAWECKWPENHNYEVVLRNATISRLMNLTSISEIKDFVTRFSELNNVNFTLSKTRKNKDGSQYRLYKCHHGADRMRGSKITDTK